RDNDLENPVKRPSVLRTSDSSAHCFDRDRFWVRPCPQANTIFSSYLAIAARTAVTRHDLLDSPRRRRLYVAVASFWLCVSSRSLRLSILVRRMSACGTLLRIQNTPSGPERTKLACYGLWVAKRRVSPPTRAFLQKPCSASSRIATATSGRAPRTGWLDFAKA